MESIDEEENTCTTCSHSGTATVPTPSCTDGVNNQSKSGKHTATAKYYDYNAYQGIPASEQFAQFMCKYRDENGHQCGQTFSLVTGSIDITGYNRILPVAFPVFVI